MKKTFLNLFFGGAFFALCIVFLNAADARSADIAFGDVDDDHLNYDAITYLEEEKVVEGYDDGTYKPEQTINRAEFLKIVMEAADVSFGSEDCDYEDVSDDAWYYKYVCKATDMGFVEGYDDGEFKPGREINFAE
ncbi:S-layer homology domain-containing protein, partial [Patescibacteria group bacterium]|nr:S-layer homology domain-containing protein [Patescibacteria group bacterium]